MTAGSSGLANVRSSSSFNPDSFTIFHCNLQGISQPLKVEEFKIFLETITFKPNLIGISEHWLTQSNKFILNKISGYKLVSLFSRSQLIRGGVSVLARSEIPVVPLEEVCEFSREGLFECCGVLLQFYQPVVYIVLYRPPKNDKITLDNFFSDLDKLLFKIVNKYKKAQIVLSGDFNINLLEDSSVKTYFLNVLKSFSLKPCISEPTRISKTSRTCIDNFLVNFEPEDTQLVETGLSDHLGQIIKFNAAVYRQKLKKSNLVSRRCFSEDNITNFISNLNSVKWSDVAQVDLRPGNINTLFKSFMENIRLQFMTSFPVKSFKLGSSCFEKNWMTRGLRISSIRKRELHVLSKITCNTKFHCYVKMYKKIFKKCVKMAKTNFNSSRIESSSNTIKTVWDVVKEETGKPTPNSSIGNINFNDVEIADKRQIANILNYHFVSVSSDKNISPDFLKAISMIPQTFTPDNKLDSFDNVTDLEILKILKSLKPKKSTGWDEIPPFLLKASAHSLYKPLTKLVNFSLQEGVFPDLLKFSIVKPLRKNPKSTSIDNFRPISLLTSISKIFERVVFNILYRYLESNGILTSCQYGFRKGRSTIDAIFKFLNVVSKGVDGSEYTVGAFCDLSKAFDCVDHEILLGKLWCYGVRGSVLNWIASYLYNRQQKVVVDSDGESGYLPVSAGVPQGSILGPLLFLVYINDLPLAAFSDSVVLYADDTSLVVSHKNKSSMLNCLNDSLQRLSSWFNVNGLQLNADKSQFINFSINNRNCLQYDSSYLSHDLNVVSSCKFLGLIIDSCLTWRQHIDQLLPKLSQAFFALLTLSHTVDNKILKQVYFAYVQSLLSYGVIFWGNSLESDRVFKMQKRIIRLIARAGARDSCRPLFQRLQILPFPSLYLFRCLLYVKLNSEEFYNSNHTHCHNTRNVSLFQYPMHRTAFFEKSPFYTCIKLFNQLPRQIKNEVSNEVFQRKLFSFLMSNCFYSITEFLDCCARYCS